MLRRVGADRPTARNRPATPNAPNGHQPPLSLTLPSHHPLPYTPREQLPDKKEAKATSNIGSFKTILGAKAAGDAGESNVPWQGAKTSMNEFRV